MASAIALLVMASVASLFSVFSRALSQGQSTIELAGRMRTAGWRLRRDLAGITVRVRPPVRPDTNSGYFELIEGPRRDTSAAPNQTILDADTDDILLFTTHSAGGLFSGRYGMNDTIESNTAEVAWFCRAARDQAVPQSLPPDTQLFNLYRRQLLVVGYVGKEPFFTPGNRAAVDRNGFDISLRLDNGGTFVPNTLADLTDRRNRFGLRDPNPASFPFTFTLQEDTTTKRNLTAPEALTFVGDRSWEDVVLTNVIAFDVRVYDPTSTALMSTGTSLLPGDPGYATGTGAFGAYIDLGSGGNGALGQAMQPRCGLNGPPTYCTWNSAYQINLSNGVDDNGNGLTDEIAEAETLPPYAVPLRGIEVRIRCYEPISRQIRQVTIRQAFNY